MQFSLKGVVISIKRNFPKIAKIITFKKPSRLQLQKCQKSVPAKYKKIGNSQKQTPANFFGHTVYSESMEDLLHLV